MNELSQLQVNIGADAATPAGGRRPETSWFEVMAKSWGSALDKQAGRIIEKAEALGEGFDEPSQITLLTAESLRMQFLSNSSHTALTSMGSALETMARKQ